MKARNYFILVGLTLLLGLGVLILRPVPSSAERDCLVLVGKVTEVYESGVKDVVVEVEGSDKKFYVNRGLERGLELNNLRTQLIDKEIVIKYPSYWTPLDPQNSTRHISKIECEGRIVFSELD